MSSSVKIPTILLGSDTNDPFPCIEHIIELFSNKNIKTIFASIGTSKSCIADLEISENLSCPIYIAPVAGYKKWKGVETLIKEKASNPDAALDINDPFFTGLEDKWVLPRNIRIQETIPWWTTGSININTAQYQTIAFNEWVTSICSTANINEVRLDIIKVDLPNELERGVILSMLDAGFRPALVLINWSHSPDIDVATTLSAGHLQNCGYTLLRIDGTKCLYYYSDQDLYMMNSWENTTVPNPMVAEIFKTFKNSQKEAEGGNASKPLPSDRKTITSTLS